MEQFKYGPIVYNTSDTDDDSGNYYWAGEPPVGYDSTGLPIDSRGFQCLDAVQCPLHPSYQVTEENNISTVFLNGEIDMDVTDKAKDAILPLIEAGKEVHINLKDVEYMDSSGISVLIESHQKATELGTKVTLKEISKSVLKVIMMAKLEQILNLD